MFQKSDGYQSPIQISDDEEDDEDAIDDLPQSSSTDIDLMVEPNLESQSIREERISIDIAKNGSSLSSSVNENSVDNLRDHSAELQCSNRSDSLLESNVNLSSKPLSTGSTRAIKGIKKGLNSAQGRSEVCGQKQRMS